MDGRGDDTSAAAMVFPVSGDDRWAVGNPKVVRGCKRVAFALALFGLGGAISLALELLHVPALFGYPMDARAALCYVAWICIGVCVGLGALLGRLQWAANHSSSSECAEPGVQIAEDAV